MATVTEITEGQAYTQNSKSSSRTRVYTVEGVVEPEEAAAATGIPDLGDAYSVTYWWLECSSIDVVQFGRDDLYKVTCVFSAQNDDGKPKNPTAGTEYWTLDLAGQSANRKTAYLQTKFGAKAKDVGLLVGVSEDGSVDGVDVIVPSATLTVSTWKTPASVDSSFIKGCLKCVGRYNDASFYGFDEGEVLCAGVRIVNKGDELYELEFSFNVQTNEAAGDLPEFIDWSTGAAITITGGKKGWQYLWVSPAAKDVAGVPSTQVKGVYIASVYKKKDFSPLGLSGTL